MNHIANIDIKNKTILIRVDYNVPIVNNKIINTFRIDASLETINYCLDRGCKVVLMSHLGRPDGQDLKYSLKSVFKYLKTFFNNRIYFSSDCISDKAISISKNLKSGEIHLLENLRFHNEELNCDKDFSRKLSQHGTVFINDAFGTAHREHSSNVRVSDFFKLKGCGFLISKEIKYLKKSIEEDNQKITLLLGGAKISDKIKLISRFESIAENILIGGAMSNNFLAAEGFNVGKSLIERDYINLARTIMHKNRNKIKYPLDFICTENINDEKNVHISRYDNIMDNHIAVDIGPETISLFSSIIKDADCVIWNGPMGIIEKKEFIKGTDKMIESIKEFTRLGGISIIGGGDSSSLIRINDFNKFTHISTGGGASLKLLAGESMPALNALE